MSNYINNELRNGEPAEDQEVTGGGLMQMSRNDAEAEMINQIEFLSSE